jgi:hypothetical protein
VIIRAPQGRIEPWDAHAMSMRTIRRGTSGGRTGDDVAATRVPDGRWQEWARP